MAFETVSIGSSHKDFDSTAVRRQERLELELLSIPPEQTAKDLERHHARVTGLLAWVCEKRLDELAKPALRRFIVACVAVEYLEILNDERGYNVWGAGWSPIAMQALTEYTGEGRMVSSASNITEPREMDTVLLGELRTSALSAMKPAGTYSQYAFVSGVASEKLYVPMIPEELVSRDHEPPQAA